MKGKKLKKIGSTRSAHVFFTYDNDIYNDQDNENYNNYEYDDGD